MPSSRWGELNFQKFLQKSKVLKYKMKVLN